MLGTSSMGLAASVSDRIQSLREIRRNREVHTQLLLLLSSDGLLVLDGEEARVLSSTINDHLITISASRLHLHLRGRLDVRLQGLRALLLAGTFGVQLDDGLLFGNGKVLRLLLLFVLRSWLSGSRTEDVVSQTEAFRKLLALLLGLLLGGKRGRTRSANLPRLSWRRLLVDFHRFRSILDDLSGLLFLHFVLRRQRLLLDLLGSTFHLLGLLLLRLLLLMLHSFLNRSDVGLTLLQLAQRVLHERRIQRRVHRQRSRRLLAILNSGLLDPIRDGRRRTMVDWRRRTARRGIAAEAKVDVDLLWLLLLGVGFIDLRDWARSGERRGRTRGVVR